jgi:hypothetical protein
MSYFQFTLLLITLPFLIWAQEDTTKIKKFGWSEKVVGTLNFNQSKFDNWQRGGEDSWSWQTDVIGVVEYDQEKYAWKNFGKLAYGNSKTGNQEARKSADEIKLESVLSYKIGIKLNPYIAVTGQTQLVEGFIYTDTSKIRISNFMDPGYFTQAVGLEYASSDKFSTRFGASIKETATQTQIAADRFAVGEKPRIEYGAESVYSLNYKVTENILYATKLELFSNLKAFDEIDANWDNIFTAKVAEYLNVSFTFNIFYDKDVDIQRQLKETLAVGLTYNLL